VRSSGRRAAPTARQPESPEAAYTEAVKRLARQPQSRAALALRLARLGYAEEAVRGALERVVADGYLDDREFAASLVRRRAQGRGAGARPGTGPAGPKATGQPGGITSHRGSAAEPPGIQQRPGLPNLPHAE